MSKSKWFVFSALAGAGTLGAGAARAGHGPDLQWSVTIGTPASTRAAHVIAQPHAAYRIAAPFHGPQRDQRFYREPTRWDRDGDGIPNRHDRMYNPRWDVEATAYPTARTGTDTATARRTGTIATTAGPGVAEAHPQCDSCPIHPRLLWRASLCRS